MPQSALNLNDANIDKRSQFADSVLKEVFGIVPKDIRPIAYEKDFPFPYNNFVYAVDLEAEAAIRTNHNLHQHQSQPGTTEIPPKLSGFVLRLANAASGYNDKARVENEVAALFVARNALDEAKLQNLIPRVFGWGSASDGQQGWILQERMPGSALSDDFDGLSIQNNIFDGGPFPSYEALIKGTVVSKLTKADADPRIKGWWENDVRNRLEKFISQGLHSNKAEMGPFKVLVHSDYSFDNLLYDKDTMDMTAVLDFDFSHIATVADEFLRSLGHGIGRFPASRDGGEDSRALRKAMLHGFPASVPPSTEAVQWDTAKAWDDALLEKNVERPSNIKLLDPVSEVFWLSSQILPFKLCNEVVIGNSTEEQLAEWRKDGESQLNEFLTEHGS